jgi:hypothetical protein
MALHYEDPFRMTARGGELKIASYFVYIATTLAPERESQRITLKQKRLPLREAFSVD